MLVSQGLRVGAMVTGGLRGSPGIVDVCAPGIVTVSLFGSGPLIYVPTPFAPLRGAIGSFYYGTTTRLPSPSTYWIYAAQPGRYKLTWSAHNGVRLLATGLPVGSSVFQLAAGTYKVRVVAQDGVPPIFHLQS